MQSRRSLEQPGNQPLICLEGHPPRPGKIRSGCMFAARCPSAMHICQQKDPPYEQLSHNKSVQCWLPQASREFHDPPTP